MWLSVYVNRPRIHICGDDQILAVLHERGIGIRPDPPLPVRVGYARLGRILNCSTVGQLSRRSREWAAGVSLYKLIAFVPCTQLN